MFERFLDAWAMSPDEESPLRAGTTDGAGSPRRDARVGWISRTSSSPSRRVSSFYRGELEEFPDDVRVAFMKTTQSGSRRCSRG